MKFRTERDVFLEAVVTAGRAAAPRSALGGASPSLQMTLRGNRLELTGSDPDLVIEARVGVSGEGDGVALVPSRLLADIARSFDPGAISVSSTDEDVVLSSGRAEFVVRMPVGAEITRLSSVEGEGLQLPAQLFAEGLRQVVRAALTDDTRAPQLTGVLVVATETGLRLVATDSYRLAYRDLAGLTLLEPGTEVLIPARALAEIQRLIGDSRDESATLCFQHSELDAVFELDDVRLTTRLLKGPFPDYKRLLPESYPNKLEVDRDDLTAALRRVRLMVRDAKDSTTPVRIAFTTGGAELTVLTAESGRASEPVDGQFSGEDVMVAFNPTYLLDGIEAIRSDTVILEIIDSTKPATVRGKDDEDYRYLLMPVRVS